jgi:hypothetical protein
MGFTPHIYVPACSTSRSIRPVNCLNLLAKPDFRTTAADTPDLDRSPKIVCEKVRSPCLGRGRWSPLADYRLRQSACVTREY